MLTSKLHQTTAFILESCQPHISHVVSHNESNCQPHDILWLKISKTKGTKGIYLSVSPKTFMFDIPICECKVYRVDETGKHLVINNITSEADIALQNSISYINSLCVFDATKTDLPPSDLIEDVLDHLDCKSANLVLFGGINEVGKRITAKSLVEQVINNKLYRYDDVVVINNEEDFTVLLDNISIGRVDHPVFVVFNEPDIIGDMFALRTLIEANCSVVVVTQATTFSSMANTLLEGLEGNKRELIIEDVKTSLVCMVLHGVAAVTANNYCKYTYKIMSATNNRGLNIFDMMVLNGETLPISGFPA